MFIVLFSAFNLKIETNNRYHVKQNYSLKARYNNKLNFILIDFPNKIVIKYQSYCINVYGYNLLK